MNNFNKYYLIVAIGCINSLYSLGLVVSNFGEKVNRSNLIYLLCSLLFTAFSILLVKENPVVVEVNNKNSDN